MNLEKITKILNEIVRLEIASEYDAAIDLLRPLLNVPIPGPRVVEAYARLSSHVNEQEKAIEKIEETLVKFTIAPQLKSALQFQAGNLYDYFGEYDKAFLHYKSANDALPVQFDVQTYTPFIEEMKSFFTRSALDALEHADSSDIVSAFIVGMPRSGTTLTEQIMDRHSRIHGAGELTTINEIVGTLQQRFSLSSSYPACLKELTTKQLNTLAEQYLTTAKGGTSGISCVTDKMPSNCGHLGFIELILPSTKIIHCRRHPIDTCLSCYFQNFANTHQYSRRLDDLAKMYRIYMNMVNMWDDVINIPVHELRYEDMVNDQEASSKSLIEFTGLEWQENCLRFHDSKREVNTCSYNQVRKPIYTKSMNRWKNYEKHIGPLISELDDLVEQYNTN